MGKLSTALNTYSIWDCAGVVQLCCRNPYVVCGGKEYLRSKATYISGRNLYAVRGDRDLDYFANPATIIERSSNFVRKIKKIASLAAALTLVCSLGANSMAYMRESLYKDNPEMVDVRVNGVVTEFPDAKPYIDENDRTLIPLRFVSEALGADVSWNQQHKIASVEKDGIRCDITIGSKAMAVTQNGKTSTVMMDTQAVLKDSRTFVPIRYVAEALGAYVDYANYWKMVGIWQDVLSPKQIEMLQSYPFDDPMTTLTASRESADIASNYDKYLSYERTLAYGHNWAVGNYGPDRDKSGFKTFADAREHLYWSSGYEKLKVYPLKFPYLSMKYNQDVDDYFRLLFEDITARIVHFKELNMGPLEFYTDQSCMYQPDDIDQMIAVRGILKHKGPYTTKLDNLPRELTETDDPRWLKNIVHYVSPDYKWRAEIDRSKYEDEYAIVDLVYYNRGDSVVYLTSNVIIDGLNASDVFM